MKILWYTDTHFGLSGSFSRPSATGFTTRLDETLEMHSWIAKQVQEHKPDLTLHGGDIYKPQVTLHGMEVSASARGTGKIIRASKQHLTLLGNHDYISRDTRVTAIDWLNELPNSKVIKQIDYMEDIVEGCILVFCPYVFDYTHAIRRITEFKPENYTKAFFFGHAEIGGVLNAMVVDLGTGEKKKHFSESGNALPVEFLSKFDLAFNGHHHIPQKPAENVYLTGSAQQFTVTEYSDEFLRGIYLIDTETCEVQFIENKVTPAIYRVENTPDRLRRLNPNSYVIYYYNPKESAPEDVKPMLENFKGYQIRPLGTDKFKPIVSVEFESKDEDYTGLYKEYLSTVAFESKDLEKKVREAGIEIVQEAEDTK